MFNGRTFSMNKDLAKQIIEPLAEVIWIRTCTEAYFTYFYWMLISGKLLCDI